VCLSSLSFPHGGSVAAVGLHHSQPKNILLPAAFLLLLQQQQQQQQQ